MQANIPLGVLSGRIQLPTHPNNIQCRKPRHRIRTKIGIVFENGSATEEQESMAR